MSGLASCSQENPKMIFCFPNLVTKEGLLLGSISDCEVEFNFVCNGSSLVQGSIDVENV